MRTVKDLSNNQKQRMLRYVSRYPDVSSKDLANDLNLDVKTIVAWKAWLTRNMGKAFNASLA